MNKPLKSRWIILALIIFFPIGVTLMWLKSSWSNRTKWIVTAICAVLLLSSIISNATSQNSATSTDHANAAASTPTPQQEQAQAEQPTATPTVNPDKKAVMQYAAQIMPLDAQLEKQSSVIAQDVTGDSVDFSQLRTDAVTAETTYKAVQQELNAMQVPSEMTETHSHFTTAITLYIQGLDEVVKGIDDDDSTEITAGAKVYTQGNQELEKATTAAKAYLAQ